jgi:hypothetical protein
MPSAREIDSLQPTGPLADWPSIAAASAELRRPRRPRRGGEYAVVLELVPTGATSSRLVGRRSSRVEGVRR